jgi:hypothetical protein
MQKVIAQEQNAMQEPSMEYLRYVGDKYGKE